ncbi:hypothetical protein PF011_g9736 [Phytophthora fragariae]|uniref:Uncharacterized protein n=1 Tax=Phytophthora fragariae TaxID=53985 RepID=A0A6A3KUH9_9STRA|nr:hypothetical protein PF011_g9736 [Phytophthora fragariae]
MRTTFTIEDDKELVQLASAHVDAGARISWADVAQRMRRADHSARELQQRLRTLMKTWGTDIRLFPLSFFTQVQRPRGRPTEVTRQLRQDATQRQRRAAARRPTPATPALPALPERQRTSTSSGSCVSRAPTAGPAQPALPATSASPVPLAPPPPPAPSAHLSELQARLWHDPDLQQQHRRL